MVQRLAHPTGDMALAGSIPTTRHVVFAMGKIPSVSTRLKAVDC